MALGILQRIGFKEVVCAADGVNALSEMTVRGGGDAFDIVLTDLHMPRKVGLRRASISQQSKSTYRCLLLLDSAKTSRKFEMTSDSEPFDAKGAHSLTCLELE